MNWPDLGMGLGFRAPIGDSIRRHHEEIQWVEVISENYFGNALADLSDIASLFPVVPHGVELSIGSVERPDEEYLSQLAAVLMTSKAAWFSDHLCFTKADGVETGLLLPVPLTHEMAVIIGRRARYLQDWANRPFLLENIFRSFVLQGDMIETAFITKVLDEADCGLLLDLTNLCYVAWNEQADPVERLLEFPLSRVVQVHVAGGSKTPRGLWADTHSAPVPEAVWGLLKELVRRTHVRAVLLERDQNFPEDFKEILDDLATGRRILGSGR